tara:strand:+ start:12316 stop:13032 length:717 start_codon:yes stop_codon:yes gene_type:complete
MAIGWKKLATYNDGGDKIQGNITGKAYEGLENILTKAEGGTGTNLAEGTAGQILASDGNNMVWLDGPSAPGQFMVSDGEGTWKWADIATTHNHDTEYLSLTSSNQKEITGNFNIDGALEVTGDCIFANPIEITATTQNNGQLNNGASNDGEGSGWFIDIDGGNEGTPESQDPSIVWRTNIYSTGAEGWVCGKYATDERVIQTFYPSTLDISSPPATVTLPGVWAQDDQGNVYMSTVTA